MAPNRVILISCGSFNPLTNMHLRMFEIARDHLHKMGNHVVVGGVISPVHDSYGKDDLTTMDHRCAMIKLAIKNNDWISLSTWETRQNNWTRTLITLQHHQSLLNCYLLDSSIMENCFDAKDFDWIPESIKNSTDKTPIQIKLLCGADLLESFAKPGVWDEKDIEAIISQHGLVVVTREGFCPNKFIHHSDVLYKHMNNIFIVTEWIPNEVSSTRIRRALRRGESIRYLVQDSVINYIYKNGVYNAKNPSTTAKFEINSNNYLNIDDKYQSVLLTPSPSHDVTMITPSSMDIINLDMDNKLIKNIQNLPKIIETIDDVNNKNSSIYSSLKTNYPGQAKQIIATENGESIIFREVGSENNSTKNEKKDDILSDNNFNNNSINFIEKNICNFDCNDYQVDAEKDKKISSIVNEDQSSENQEISSIVNKIEETTIVTQSIPQIQEENIDCQDVYERVVQVRKSNSTSSSDDNDGNIIKSIVNSRKNINEPKSPEQLVPIMIEEIKNNNINTDNEKDINNCELINLPEEKKDKAEDDDDDEEEEEVDNSINLQEDISTISGADEKEDFCSVCYSKERTIKNNIYTPRSSSSSPNELDSTECDICGSYDVHEAETMAGIPQCELCEICGDLAMDEDVIASSRHELDDIIEAKILSSSSNYGSSNSLKKKIELSENIQGNVKIVDITDENFEEINVIDNIIDDKKSKMMEIVESPVSTSIEEFSDDDDDGDDSTLDDVEFEIENCGLDVDEKIIEETTSIDGNIIETSETLIKLNDKISKSNIENRMNRGSSLNCRNTKYRSQTKRKYSSVDNLPISKKSIDNIKQQDNNNNSSTIVINRGRFIGSVDNVRYPRASKSNSQFRMSADDIGRIKETGEDKNEQHKFLVRHQSERNSRISPDTIKFIFSKHGIKIISDRETAL